MKQLKQLWTNLQASFWCVPSLIAAFSILLAVAFDRSGCSPDWRVSWTGCNWPGALRTRPTSADRDLPSRHSPTGRVLIVADLDPPRDTSRAARKYESPSAMKKSKKNPPTPEHGGKSVKGGGRPSYAPTPAQKDIDAGTGHSVTGYQMTPGIADPGVPGIRTNPVEKGRDPQPANPHPHGQVPSLKGELTAEHLKP